ncbi:MFS transporter [Enorma burkinafasonensis]|uniref:MFS transporter n=1 Tax=Enorma burkinafasonensis TaxID=2590867 RepID=UPI0026F0FA6D|nr:MFS transporter [Enorma burkinafasonensis]MCI7731435.1 MFS transporter [Enorma burkinafasonensis]
MVAHPAPARLPRGTWALVAVRFLLYLGMQAAYFIGVIGTLTYRLGADTVYLSVTVGVLAAAVVVGNAVGGALLDLRGPRAHTAVTLGCTLAVSLAFQVVELDAARVLGLGALFSFSMGLNYLFLSAYPVYLTGDADELKRVNALMSVASYASVAAGPALGAAVATVLPSERVFLVAAVLALAAGAAAVPLMRRCSAVSGAGGAMRERARAGTADARDGGASGSAVATGEPAGERAGGGAHGEPTFLDALRLVMVTPSLALLFWVGLLSYAGYGAFDPLESLFYRDVLKVDIAWMGWLSSAAGVGSVAGSVLALKVPRRHVNVRTLMLLIALEGAACLLYVGTPHVACALGGQLLLGVAFGAITPLQSTLVQLHTPLGVMGRVNSIMNAGFNGAGVLPLVAAPAAAAAFGVQGVLVGASAFVLAVPVACLALLRRRIARIVEDERSGLPSRNKTRQEEL